MSDDGPRPGPDPSSAGPEHDAWLREALRHAPDASASPPPSLRDAILAEARAATRTGATRRAAAAPSLYEHAIAFWSWLARPQVAAGFASVMAATLVGMLWWDRPMDETMLPPAASPATMAPKSAQERSAAADERPSSPAVADKAAAMPADRLQESAREQQAARAAAEGRARSQADAKQAATAERASKAERKDDKLATPASPRIATASPPNAAATPTAGEPRPAADAPSPFPARSPVEADAATRERAPMAAARAPAPPPPPAPAAMQQPAPPQARTEPFGLAKKVDSGEKDTAGAKARSPASVPELPAPGAAGALGSATLDRGEARGPGGTVTQNAAAPGARPPAAAPAVPAARPMAPLLAALASDEAGWSRRLASGESAAVDAALRTWLAQVQAAAARWDTATERGTRRDAAAAPFPDTVLRLERDGRLGAVVQLEDGGVFFDPLAGSAWFAPLPPEVVARLRATLPPARR